MSEGKPELRSVLLKLLKLDVEHTRKIERVRDAGLDVECFQIDLLSVVLDALGVPQDNSAEMFEKHGVAGYERAECFCRDMFGERWDQIIGSGTDEDIAEFLDWIMREARTGFKGDVHWN